MLTPSYQLTTTANLLNCNNDKLTAEQTTIAKGKRVIGTIKTINQMQFLKITVVREANNWQPEVKYLPMDVLKKAKPCNCSHIIILE